MTETTSPAGPSTASSTRPSGPTTSMSATPAWASPSGTWPYPRCAASSRSSRAPSSWPRTRSTRRSSVTIQAGSVDTHDENRDNHLRTNDFFDVENHPTWTFTSTAIRPVTRHRVEGGRRPDHPWGDQPGDPRRHPRGRGEGPLRQPPGRASAPPPPSTVTTSACRSAASWRPAAWSWPRRSTSRSSSRRPCGPEPDRPSARTGRLEPTVAAPERAATGVARAGDRAVVGTGTGG